MAETCIGALSSTVASSHLATVGDCDATASASGAVVRAREEIAGEKLTFALAEGYEVSSKVRGLKVTFVGGYLRMYEGK